LLDFFNNKKEEFYLLKGLSDFFFKLYCRLQDPVFRSNFWSPKAEAENLDPDPFSASKRPQKQSLPNNQAKRQYMAGFDKCSKESANDWVYMG
jgi:hypothetical protein